MQLINGFNYSYWELKQYFKTFDLIIIGSGIVGLSTAISFKKKNPKATVLILEKGMLPNGASTKNAGFACFGSAGELLNDLKSMPEQHVWETVKMRWDGLQLLRQRLTDAQLGYQALGGFELFDSIEEYTNCKEQINFLNSEMERVLDLKSCFKDLSADALPLKGLTGVFFNAYEGQLDTSLMMKNLLALARSQDIEILNNVQIEALHSLFDVVELKSDRGIFKARQVVVATNGFASKLLTLEDVRPARAQVLITKPIQGLSLKGTFHFFKGYYYFRNIDDRILFGGGRHLDFDDETTSEQGLNISIQQELDRLLKEMILPGQNAEVEFRWSGIMGVGSEKKPIIKEVQKNVLAAVRMGGMGIAIGSLVGETASSKLS